MSTLTSRPQVPASPPSTNGAARPAKAPAASSTKQTYLLSYNGISAVLWGLLLTRLLLLLPLFGPQNLFGGTDSFTRDIQTLALLEPLHSLLGVVRAPLLTTLMQVSSRLLLVWGIAWLFPAAITSGGADGGWAWAGMLVAWSVTEVVRYGYFACALGRGGRVPNALVWARYNFFYVLYPLGISCECWLVARAVRTGVAERELGPVAKWTLIAVLGIYVPGSYILYTHMIAQRRRVMRGKQRAE
ncbi:tyrosine phosphatase-like protein [Phyllosticta citriasiana]|uniref:Very-long-chain (3R)-3-hydroxyacyl-CoA dehydratase n=1 Tax=Phyllosticta citriasiana TaxID=595635 RepID=A0ABR1KJL5_9PEZI